MMKKSRIYLLLQAAVCIALVILLSVSAAGILREGLARKAGHSLESIYTPETVAEKLAPIVPLLIAGIGLLFAGLLLGWKDENAEKPVKDAEISRNLLVLHVARPSGAMLAERRRQRRLVWTGRGLFALCMIPVFVYILNPAHFPEADLEGMFLGLIRVLLPWTAAGLGSLAVTSVLREKSILRETQAAHERLKEEKAAGVTAEPRPADPLKKKAVLQAVIIVLAVVLIIAGVFIGSALDVLYKAITICTECVGLG